MPRQSEVVSPNAPTSAASEIDTETEESPGGPASIRDRLLRPRTLLSFGLALVILIYFFRRMDLNLSEIADNIRAANIGLLLVAIGSYVVTIVVRSFRWRWMLVKAGAGSIPGTTVPAMGYLTAVLVVSWFFNCILPAKLGDAFRIYRVKVDNGIRYTIGFGTVVTERFIDLVVLVFFLAGSSVFAFHGDLPSRASNALAFGGMLVLAAVIGLIVIWVFRRQIEGRLPSRFQNSWGALQHSMFVNLRSPWVPAGLSVLIWSLEAGRVFFVARALDVDLSIEMAVFVGLMAALLTTLPITPAGLGVVEVAMVAVLKIADVPANLAASIAVLDRLITYWGLIVIGAMVYLWMLRKARA